MKGPKDPVDHARTTRPHAGESMKDNKNHAGAHRDRGGPGAVRLVPGGVRDETSRTSVDSGFACRCGVRRRRGGCPSSTAGCGASKNVGTQSIPMLMRQRPSS